jgi:hypothetical protein
VRDAFKVIKKIKGEAEYLKEVLHIDVNNLHEVGGKIVEDPAHPFIGRGADVIANEIYQGLFARQEFYQALGIAPESIDALPEQFLFRANPKSARANRTKIG